MVVRPSRTESVPSFTRLIGTDKCLSNRQMLAGMLDSNPNFSIIFGLEFLVGWFEFDLRATPSQHSGLTFGSVFRDRGTICGTGD